MIRPFQLNTSHQSSQIQLATARLLLSESTGSNRQTQSQKGQDWSFGDEGRVLTSVKTHWNAHFGHLQTFGLL